MDYHINRPERIRPEDNVYKSRNTNIAICVDLVIFLFFKISYENDSSENVVLLLIYIYI